MNNKNLFMSISLVIFIILVSFAGAYDISNYSNPDIRFFDSSIENHTHISGLTFGIGTGSIDYIFPILYGDFFSSLNQSYSLTVRYMNLQEFGFNLGGGKKDTGSINEFGLLAGFYRIENGIYLSASGGLGLVSGNITRLDVNDKPRKWGEPTDIIFSIPLEIKLILRPFHTFGIGVIGFANVNTNTSYYGILIGINLFNQ